MRCYASEAAAKATKAELGDIQPIITAVVTSHFDTCGDLILPALHGSTPVLDLCEVASQEASVLHEDHEGGLTRQKACWVQMSGIVWDRWAV